MSALKSLVNTSNAAFESVSKTAKKVSAEIAEASVEAATNSAKAASRRCPWQEGDQRRLMPERYPIKSPQQCGLFNLAPRGMGRQRTP